tara:strand:- start:215 stop:910 length:696 start_codon:yes stop_codon:yes gene_type:complete
VSGGGAGLIQLPALILFGIPYYKALASHKIATVALGLGGSLRNYKNLENNFLIILQLLIFGIPGVILGTFLVKIISDEFLYLLLALFTILLGIYSFCKPNLGLNSIQKEIRPFTYIRFNSIAFIIGILNGSISSGTGLLVTILLIHTFGLDFLSSISITFLTVGIFWNAAGAIALSKIGPLPLNLLSILILGSFLGGYSGAHLSNLKGNKFIKKLFTLLCFLIGLTLFFKL